MVTTEKKNTNPQSRSPHSPGTWESNMSSNTAYKAPTTNLQVPGLDVKHVDEELHVAEDVLPLRVEVMLVERVLPARERPGERMMPEFYHNGSVFRMNVAQKQPETTQQGGTGCGNVHANEKAHSGRSGTKIDRYLLRGKKIT